MAWYREFGTTEKLFILAFVVLYILYVIRIIRIGRALHTPYHAVFIKLILRSAVFLLLIIALLGPMFGAARKEIKSVGKDIMICVDISKSMDATDIPPTRLEKVKFELKKIVDAFSSDRIGIIIFSSEAFMQCPLTYDDNALDLFIETLSTGLVNSGGTDFGPPLEMALKKLENQDTHIGTKSKIIILISDGEDFGEDTGDMAKEVEDKGIKLFTLGIGTTEGGTIQTANGVKKDKRGETVVTKLNPQSLKNLASMTGGYYFEINQTRNDISKMISTIGGIEGEVRDSRTVDTSANRYYYFLGLAVVLIALDILVNVNVIRI